LSIIPKLYGELPEFLFYEFIVRNAVIFFHPALVQSAHLDRFIGFLHFHTCSYQEFPLMAKDSFILNKITSKLFILYFYLLNYGNSSFSLIFHVGGHLWEMGHVCSKFYPLAFQKYPALWSKPMEWIIWLYILFQFL